MKKVIFFTDLEWAYGIIHTELSKYLFQNDIVSNTLYNARSYTIDEIRELDNVTDYYLMSPYQFVSLMTYNVISPSKCIIVCHGISDIKQIAVEHEYPFKNIMNNIKEYVVVSYFLKQKSIEMGVDRIPKVCNVGINYYSFYNKKISQELKTVGYAGAYSDRDMINKDPHVAKIKRSWLVKECAQDCGLNFLPAHTYHSSWVTMPGFYSNIDCVIVSSEHEGASLPLIEAAAAGKLVISTPVGLIFDKCGFKGADIVSIEENEFKAQCCNLLNYYKNNPSYYVERCLEIQEHAKSYDWKYCIKDWVQLFN